MTPLTGKWLRKAIGGALFLGAVFAVPYVGTALWLPGLGGLFGLLILMAEQRNEDAQDDEAEAGHASREAEDADRGRPDAR